MKSFKWVLMLIVLMFASVSFANTIWTYGGGLNFSKQTLTNPTPGFYSFPLIGVSASPLVFQNSEVYLEPNYGLSFVYVFGQGTMSPDTNGDFSFSTNGVLFGVQAGGGAFQTQADGGTEVGKGFLGPCVFAPGTFGNIGIGVAQQFNEPFNPFVNVLFVQSFDIGGGIGPFKW